MITKLAKQKISKRYRGLGTVIDLTIYGCSDESVLDGSFRLIQYYESLLTVNRADSELMRVNQAAGLNAVQVSDAVYHLSKLAVQKSQEHFGFNIAIGPLVRLWHIGFFDAHVPADLDIAEHLQLINPDKIIFNDDEFSIFLQEVGMELDLGGIAKGYIADRLKDFWCSHGITSGIINLGGNVILMGQAPHQEDKKWRLGIRNPLNQTGETILQVRTTACSAVTSGIAERHLESKGKSYHHILDPETGYPHDNNLASVTVFSKFSLDGEIETTRLFFAGEAEESWLKQSFDFYGAVFITKDKKVYLLGLQPENVRLTDTSFQIFQKNPPF